MGEKVFMQGNQAMAGEERENPVRRLVKLQKTIMNSPWRFLSTRRSNRG